MTNTSKILSYPLTLGHSDIDTVGNPAQYVLFKINNTTSASKLRDDTSEQPVFVTTERLGTGISSVPTYRMPADKTVLEKYDTNSVIATRWVQQKEMVRVEKSIILPMPEDHSVETNIEYQEHDQSALTKFADTANVGVGNTVGGLAKSIIYDLQQKGFNAVGGAVGAGQITSSRDLLAANRNIVNPKKELLYNGFSRRTFNFRFMLAPKSQQESEAVNRIIETFRFYSLPELEANRMFYLFPGEFEISFIHGSKDNPNVPRIATCACTNVSTNYSPMGQWATLPDGSPVVKTLSLTFKELELIDRRRVYTKDQPIISGF